MLAEYEATAPPAGVFAVVVAGAEGAEVDLLAFSARILEVWEELVGGCP
jgi:hypothetical protein